jgi:hypothetical protein
MSSGMVQLVAWLTVPGVQTIGMFLYSGSTSKVSESSTLIRLVDSENMSQSMEGTATLRNVGNALTVDTAKHLRRVQTKVYTVFFQKE